MRPTEPENGMDEDDAAVSLSRSKAAKAEATQDRASRSENGQERPARRVAAKQKKHQPHQLQHFMDLVRELQTPTQRAATTQ